VCYLDKIPQQARVGFANWLWFQGLAPEDQEAALIAFGRRLSDGGPGDLIPACAKAFGAEHAEAVANLLSVFVSTVERDAATIPTTSTLLADLFEGQATVSKSRCGRATKAWCSSTPTISFAVPW
jgi:hypothetical protein